MTARFLVRPEAARRHLLRRQKQSIVTRNLFKEKHVWYAA